MTAERTARPPWRWSSAISSPVNVAGPGIHATRAESSGSPVVGSRRVRRDKRRGGGSRFATLVTRSAVAGPLIRMTATAARPKPLAGAKMVVPSFIAQPRRRVGSYVGPLYSRRKEWFLLETILSERTLETRASGSCAKEGPEREPSTRKRENLDTPQAQKGRETQRPSGIHRVEEVVVALGLAQLVHEELDGVRDAHRVEDAAQHVGLLERIRRHQKLFLASA